MKVDVEFIAVPKLYERAAKEGFRVQPAMWGTWEIKNKKDFIQQAKKYDEKDDGYCVFRCCVANKDIDSFNNE